MDLVYIIGMMKEKEKREGDMENDYYEEEMTIGEQDALYDDDDDGITELREQRQRMSWRKR